jgi:hypothetical protein
LKKKGEASHLFSLSRLVLFNLTLNSLGEQQVFCKTVLAASIAISRRLLFVSTERVDQGIHCLSGNRAEAYAALVIALRALQAAFQALPLFFAPPPQTEQIPEMGAHKNSNIKKGRGCPPPIFYV